jgi:monoamine oxidase
LIDLGLESLSAIFHIPVSALSEHLVNYRVDDWSQDPYSLGAYSYEKVGEAPFRKILRTPVGNTLFFAGEALYEGDHTPGTVEAALATGREAAENLLASQL